PAWRPWTTTKHGSGGHGPPITLLAIDAIQVDAVEQHLQVGGADLQAGRLALRKTKAALLQAFVDDDETILVPVEQLDAVGPLVAKDEQLARQRVAGQLLADDLGQCIE